MSAEAENIHPLINDKLFQYLLKEIEENYICKSGNFSLMTDPVVLETGQIYQYDNIVKWLISTKNTTCPLTNTQLNKSSKKNTSSSRISGFLVYNIPLVKTILEGKIKKITEMLEEYVFDYDIRTLESYLEEKYFDVISKIQTYKKEKADWEGAAIFGDEESMEKMMKELYFNEGMNQDKQKALKWAEKLVNHYDNKSGKFRVAYAHHIGEYDYEKDNGKAIKLYEELAESGETASMYNAGIIFGGNNLERNQKKAYQWFEKGHTKNHFGCSVNFANYCHDGTGCEVNKQKAGEIYKNISNKMIENREEPLKQSVREACYNYGMILFMKGDIINGLQYIKCAQKNGCEKSKKKLERMLRAGREDEENEQESDEGSEEESNEESEQENDDEEEASDEEDASDQEENADY